MTSHDVLCVCGSILRLRQVHAAAAACLHVTVTMHAKYLRRSFQPGGSLLGKQASVAILGNAKLMRFLRQTEMASHDL
jgi:hypothetical protein